MYTDTPSLEHYLEEENSSEVKFRAGQTYRRNKKTNNKLDKRTVNFILGKICEGLHIAEIHRRYKEKLPDIRYIYSKFLNDSDLKAKVDQAYTVLLYRSIDLLHATAQRMSEPNSSNDWKESEAQLRRQADELKFFLGKMGKILSNRFFKSHINTTKRNYNIRKIK